MDILKRIEELRDARGWSNYRLAHEAGIQEGSLNNLFRLNNNPSLSTLMSICEGLGITLSQFFTEDGEPVVLSKEQSALLDAWSTLTADKKAAVLAIIKLM